MSLGWLRFIKSGDEAEVRVKTELLSEKLLSLLLLLLLNFWVIAPNTLFRLGRMTAFGSRSYSIVTEDDEIDEEDVEAELFGVVRLAAFNLKKY